MCTSHDLCVTCSRSEWEQDAAASLAVSSLDVHFKFWWRCFDELSYFQLLLWRDSNFLNGGMSAIKLWKRRETRGDDNSARLWRRCWSEGFLHKDIRWMFYYYHFCVMIAVSLSPSHYLSFTNYKLRCVSNCVICISDNFFMTRQNWHETNYWVIMWDKLLKHWWDVEKHLKNHKTTSWLW